MEIHNMGTTTQYSGPTWNGNGFSEHEPNNLWGRLPESFKEIALAEILEGNKPISILENKERGIILLEFEKGPLAKPLSNSEITLHTSHRYGNYCYDGTKATYEDVSTGCFLAFSDPEFQEPTF